MSRITFIKEKCTGCNTCSVACMDQNDFDPKTGAEPFRFVKAADQQFKTKVCVHCGRCIGECPVSAISRDEQTGFVIVDEDKCVGCGTCREACPLSVPQIIDGKMKKCDGCNERVKAGLLPACVKACPTKALVLE